MTATPAVKPKLRGVLHEVAFYVTLVAAALLAWRVAEEVRGAALVYAASLACLFGVSALYHRPTWQPRARAWMRRADHSAIYVLIAGTYTPFATLLDADSGRTMLLVAWGGAAAGVLVSLFWVGAPKALSAGLYVLLGWAVLPFLGDLHVAAGLSTLLLLAGGGVAYTVGAVVYAMKRPNPVPGWFGYHEVFHALVIVAAVIHFVAVVRVLPQA